MGTRIRKAKPARARYSIWIANPYGELPADLHPNLGRFYRALVNCSRVAPDVPLDLAQAAALGGVTEKDIIECIAILHQRGLLELTPIEEEKAEGGGRAS